MKNLVTVQMLFEMYNQESLKRISSELIDAFRNQDSRILYHYAGKLQINPEDFHNRQSLLFRKLIFAFHPDRIRHFHNRIVELHQKGDTESLQKLGAPDEPDISRYTLPREREVYTGAWFDDSFDDDPDEYLDGAWTGVYEEEEYGFIEAVRNMMYGNLFTQFLPKDLLYLEGELNLAEEGIEDLTGIEYCRNITELNLERNRIVHIGLIGELVYLKALNLSRNSIADIDDLEGLKSLRVLDLSFNDIDNACVLNSLPDLEYVNLIGNRVPEEQLMSLKERCIVLL